MENVVCLWRPKSLCGCRSLSSTWMFIFEAKMAKQPTAWELRVFDMFGVLMS